MEHEGRARLNYEVTLKVCGVSGELARAYDRSMSEQLGDRRGAYVDASSVHWDANNADLEAFFVKRSKYLGSMRRRYMMLKRNKVTTSTSTISCNVSSVSSVGRICGSVLQQA